MIVWNNDGVIPGFALENRNHWLCGEASANWEPSGAHFPLLPVWSSRPETEIIGFAGMRARTLPPSGAHFPLLPVWSSRPETEIIGFAGMRARTLPPSGSPTPILPGRGSRSETEIIGFAGRRARTLPPSGSPTPILSGRGSRSKTEIIGFAWRRARTLRTSGSPTPILSGRGSRSETGSRGTWKNRTIHGISNCITYLRSATSHMPRILRPIHAVRHKRHKRFDTKIRISVNEIRRNCENLILKRPVDAFCSRWKRNLLQKAWTVFKRVVCIQGIPWWKRKFFHAISAVIAR